MAFTPFGIRPVDELRTVYTLVPVQAAIGSPPNGFRQSTSSPTLEDRGAKTLSFQLTAPVTRGELAKLLGVAGPWTVDRLDSALPGVQVTAERAEVTHQDGNIRVRLLPIR